MVDTGVWSNLVLVQGEVHDLVLHPLIQMVEFGIQYPQSTLLLNLE